jgi:hypothetical protein
MGDEVRRMEASAGSSTSAQQTNTASTSASTTAIPSQQSFSLTASAAGEKMISDSTETTRRRYLEEKRREDKDLDYDQTEQPNSYNGYGNGCVNADDAGVSEDVHAQSIQQTPREEYFAYADSKK